MAGIALEFTTTSCNRPEILQTTYGSFVSRLKGVDFSKSTLYINVDPSPNNDSITEMEKVARKFFGNVVVNYPEEPNFAAAVIWCFSQVKGEYFFHLEDDWILTCNVDINKMIHSLSGTALQHVLNKKITSRKELGEPCFVPSLFKTEIVKRYLPLMNPVKNPEWQLKVLYRKNTNGLKSHKSVLHSRSREVSKDIGRDWLKRKGISRDYGKSRSWTPWTKWKVKK